jgi:hypothetical protein
VCVCVCVCVWVCVCVLYDICLYTFIDVMSFEHIVHVKSTKQKYIFHHLVHGQ